MTLLEAWKRSGIGVASYDYDYGVGSMEITVMCTREETLTVIIGTGDPKQFSPEDFGDLLRLLSISPEKGWRPCVDRQERR